MTSFGSDLILERLKGLHPKSIDLSLGRVERLLAALDHPERRLAPVVHIAGTNGKGSALAILDAMLQAAGYRTQRYVSPHLVRFNERILIRGEPIEEDALAHVLDVAERANGDRPITFFEVTTAAAFLAFAARPAHFLLLETGLGGRLDATNVIERPELTALSPISLDHQGFLGDTLQEIAFEKAGILKAGVPCVVGPQAPEALAVIERRAAALDVPLVVHSRDWDARAAGERLVVRLGARELDLPLPALPGAHQIDNAGLAVVLALQLQAAELDQRHLGLGLQNARWPARLQRLTCGPLPGLLPDQVELWLDGGHNPAAAEALARSLRADPRPLHLVVGMLNTKDAGNFLRPLCRIARSVHAVPVPHEPASRAASEVAAEAARFGVLTATAVDAGAAVRSIAAGTSGPARILICGSLYLAGSVLRENG